MELSKKNMARILGLAALVAAVWWAVNNLSVLRQFWGTIVSVISPLLVGVFIAYVVNLILSPMERLWHRQFDGKGKHGGKVAARLCRPVCLLVSILLVLGAIFAVCFIIIPEVVRTVQDMVGIITQYVKSLEGTYASLRDKLAEFSVSLPELKTVIDPETGLPQGVSLLDRLEQFLEEKGDMIFDTTIGVTTSVVTTVFTSAFDLLMGIAFAIYILAQKETLGRQAKHLLYASFREDKVTAFLSFLHRANESFSGFLQGQVTEAVIIAVLVFIGMSIFRFPFAPAISVLIGVTALIPILGAWIGAVIGALLILPVSLMKAVWFVVFLIVLQQIEGNLIYPKVVGKSVGLPGIWVLLAVTIGGNAFGLIGMLFGVPVCSVLYCTAREFIKARTIKKR